MKLLSTTLLAAAAAFSLAACEAQAPRPASAGSTAAPANVQTGLGSTAEDIAVTQRGGRSAAMQGGRITGIQQEGGGNVSIQRSGGGQGITNPRLSGIQQEGGGNVTLQREGVGAPSAGSGETARSARRRAQQQTQPQQ